MCGDRVLRVVWRQKIVESMDVLTGEWRREQDMPEPRQVRQTALQPLFNPVKSYSGVARSEHCGVAPVWTGRGVRGRRQPHLCDRRRERQRCVGLQQPLPKHRPVHASRRFLQQRVDTYVPRTAILALSWGRALVQVPTPCAGLCVWRVCAPQAPSCLM